MDEDLSKPIAAIISSTSAWWGAQIGEQLEMEHTGCAQDICDSPIEKVFYLAWKTLHWELCAFGSPHGGEPELNVFSPASEMDMDGLPSPENHRESVLQVDWIKGQCRVDAYRVDFVLRRFVREHRKLFIAGPKVIVECDGHDYHERTKEQAQRDKARDRDLQSAGFIVLRFTGSELWRDPMKCVRQVDEAMDDHIAREIVARRKKGT